ncbi:MAG: Hsp20/alpha crystallin family protein [Opitutus sp.]
MRIVRYTYPSLRGPSSTLSRLSRSPWTGLETEVDRLFATALGGFNGHSTAKHIPLDLFEDKENTYVRAELPGVSREDINVEMVEDYLTISASRKETVGKDDQPNEQSSAFSRSVSIPEEVQADKVSASYEDGVLTVRLPKREAAKPRKVSVTVQ